RNGRVHVIGTGHEAAATLARLVDAGFQPSIGPVPETDVAAEAARALGVETVVAEPFGSLDTQTLDAVEGYVETADATVFTGAAEGFDAAIDRLATDQQVIAVEDAVADGPRPLARLERVRTTTLESVTDAVAAAVVSRSEESDSAVVAE
ncbi:MAG TPA: hypothetical protein VJ898_10615, partial [Natrialbaceae archaeon]|nr:hypothetical protein [Natrialbaceae archaeon]